MPRERFARLDPERREAVLRAAALEFASHGFEKASYNRIIAAAGVSKGAMYYYFDDKADLFTTVVVTAAESAFGGMRALPPIENRSQFWSVLSGMLDEVFALLARDPELAGLFRAVYTAPGLEAGVGPAASLLERSREVVSELLETGRKVGAVREDVDAGLLEAAVTGLGTGLDRWFAERYEGLSPQDLARFGEQSLELVRCLVAPPEQRS